MNAARFYRKLGKKINAYRLLKGMSQEYSARFLGLHQAAFCRIENGDQKPDVAQLLMLADMYKTCLDEITSEAPIVITKEKLGKKIKSKKIQLLIRQKYILVTEPGVPETNAPQVGRQSENKN